MSAVNNLGEHVVEQLVWLWFPSSSTSKVPPLTFSPLAEG